jgi:hypothetical protein
MFPLRGNRRVACGVERILGAQFDFRGGAHGVVSGGQCCQAVGRVGRAVAGDRLERQKGVFIGLLCFLLAGGFFRSLPCCSPRKMKFSRNGLPLAENGRLPQAVVSTHRVADARKRS